MKLIFIFFSTLIMVCTLNASGKMSNESYRFLSGVILLDSQKNLSDSVKAVRYNELCRITGVKSSDVIAIIDSYRKDPEKWKSIEDSIQRSLHTKDTLQNKK